MGITSRRYPRDFDAPTLLKSPFLAKPFLSKKPHQLMPPSPTAAISLPRSALISSAVGDAVFIGQDLFVDLNWPVTEGVQFFTQNCDIDIEGEKIPLISDNCLADIFGVTNHQAGVYSNDGSYKFSFTTFTNDRQLTKTNKISCSLKVCLTGEQNTCVPATSCPQNDFNFVLPTNRR